MPDTVKRYEYDAHRNIDYSVWVITWICVFALWVGAIMLYRQIDDYQTVGLADRANLRAELILLKGKLKVEPWQVMEQLKVNEQILLRIEDKLSYANRYDFETAINHRVSTDFGPPLGPKD